MGMETLVCQEGHGERDDRKCEGMETVCQEGCGDGMS